MSASSGMTKGNFFSMAWSGRGNRGVVYLLHKNHYIPALGERMRQTWLQLSQQEQESIGQDQPRCRQLMSEKQR